MSMTTIVVGKMYYGRTHEWTQDKGKNTERDRIVFRGSLNFRDRNNGEYYNVDAVCWKDFGDKNGLVGWLEQSFLQEDGPKEKDGKPIGGQPILVTGYFRPAKKTQDVELKVKKGGKPTTITVPNVEYSTWEFVIESADFVPQAEVKQRKKTQDKDIDFDDEIDLDEIEVVTNDGDDEEFEVEQESKKKPNKTKSSNKTKQGKTKEAPPEDEDDDLFDN